MSTELIVALCALATAVAGAGVGVFKFGALAKEVETIDQLRAEIAGLRSDVQDLSRMVYELKGAMRGSMRQPSRPPLAPEDSE